ncbi:hypothetical protein [Leptothoe sp. PORK10 BA2]|uniref:hypothetical protein n=1 Tax=Leptothoe sp. PORK10 BA2 TaxID=3110254 RepID=UPI002B21DF7F|nr:hypothetical protein [Leptothoe sp. PORK10 BA2]MEA5464056.1 hypothetical protein [Leptothoe sp. PORK10 BA2]
MMQRLITLSIALLLWGLAKPTMAQTRSVEIPESRSVDVELHRGHGVTLNFRSLDATIQRAWLDDLSKVTIDFDDSRCGVVEASEGCAATVIHLRRIHPIEFPDLPATATTILTVVTGTDIYTFQLSFPNGSIPDYSVLALQQGDGPNLSGNPTLTAVTQIEQGLQVAQIRRLISPNDPLWQRIQTCLQLMRDGVATADAAQRAGVSPDLLARLMEFGARR